MHICTGNILYAYKEILILYQENWCFLNKNLEHINTNRFTVPVAEFKEFERRFKFKPRFKYGWFHLKLYLMFQDLSRRLI